MSTINNTDFDDVFIGTSTDTYYNEIIIFVSNPDCDMYELQNMCAKYSNMLLNLLEKKSNSNYENYKQRASIYDNKKIAMAKLVAETMSAKPKFAQEINYLAKLFNRCLTSEDYYNYGNKFKKFNAKYAYLSFYFCGVNIELRNMGYPSIYSDDDAECAECNPEQYIVKNHIDDNGEELIEELCDESNDADINNSTKSI